VGDDMLTIKELSRRVGIPYTTAIKYLKALQDRGFITVRRDGKRIMYPDNTEEILRQFVELIRNGIPFSQSLKKLAHGDVPLQDPVLEEIRKLRQEIADLKKENQALRDLVQMYLSRLDETKSLPAPKKSFFQRMRAWFKRNK